MGQFTTEERARVAERTESPARERPDASAPVPSSTSAARSAVGRDFADVPVHGPHRDVPADLGRSFGVDFSTVRVRRASGPPGVLGSARGEDVSLAPTHGATGPGLFAHELAHVVQHRNAAAGARPDSVPTLEAEATRAAGVVARGGRVDVRGAAAPSVTLYSTLSDQIATWVVSDDGVLMLLRAASPADRADPDVLAAVQKRFPAGTFERWRAETIIASGPETQWTTAKTMSEDLSDPAADPKDPIAPVKAYFYPGTSSEHRVLVLGGVHGTEPEGRETVERLRTRLGRATAPPDFDTVLVPELISRPGNTQAYPVGKGGRGDEHRYIGGEHGIEPNRNFPFPGESYDQARQRGAGGKPELVAKPMKPDGTGNPDYTKSAVAPSGDHTSRRMLPETRVLIALLERFKPDRIVSVHAHKELGKDKKGNDKDPTGNEAGVFVDPRGVDPNTGATDAALGTADDALTTTLLARSRRDLTAAGGDATLANRAFRGNKGGNVHYATGAHGQGNSLGMYGPVATPRKPAATTITIEVPVMAGLGADKVIDAHASAIDAVIMHKQP